jgi:hypothetical protein
MTIRGASPRLTGGFFRSVHGKIRAGAVLDLPALLQSSARCQQPGWHHCCDAFGNLPQHGADMLWRPAMTTLLPYDRDPRLDAVARRIRDEFVDMPGMQLTFEQVCRLSDLSCEDCQRVLDALVGAQVLARDAQHRFCLQQEREPLARRRAPGAAHQTSA